MDLTTRRTQVRNEGVVGSEVCASPAVNGLLWVADHEQARAAVALQCQDANQRTLSVVGVLELIHEELVNATPDAFCDIRTIAKQRTSALEQALKPFD